MGEATDSAQVLARGRHNMLANAGNWRIVPGRRTMERDGSVNPVIIL